MRLTSLQIGQTERGSPAPGSAQPGKTSRHVARFHSDWVIPETVARGQSISTP